MTVNEYKKKPVIFDAAFSISSFEHDGLGRYGDPVDPDGDLKAMEKMKKFLKPGGRLVLAVPIGKDSLVWNAHRVYGSLRLPMFLNGWKILKSFGFDKNMLHRDTGLAYDSDWKEKKIEYPQYQPVFVLENI
ncbi:DUF268 domain-containing protein [Spirochaetota bacterium]